MGLIKDYEYIKKLGIKEVLHATNLGNTLYLLNNGQKYKEFSEDYKDLTDTINIEFKNNLETQTEYYGDLLISFPKAVISTNQELLGIVSDYENGIPFTSINPLTEIDQLLYLIEYLEQGIMNITDKGWNLEDLHEENILINLSSSAKPIRVIDTDFYCLQPERDKIELYRKNMQKIFNAIIYSIIPNLKATSIFQEQDVKEQYYLASNGFIKSSEFFKLLLQKIKFNILKEKNIKTLRKSL